MGHHRGATCCAACPAYCQRPFAAGEPKQLVLTACMRKLPTILDAIAKSGTRWNDGC